MDLSKQIFCAINIACLALNRRARTVDEYRVIWLSYPHVNQCSLNLDVVETRWGNLFNERLTNWFHSKLRTCINQQKRNDYIRLDTFPLHLLEKIHCFLRKFCVVKTFHHLSIIDHITLHLHEPILRAGFITASNEHIQCTVKNVFLPKIDWWHSIENSATDL